MECAFKKNISSVTAVNAKQGTRRSAKPLPIITCESNKLPHVAEGSLLRSISRDKSQGSCSRGSTGSRHLYARTLWRLRRWLARSLARLLARSLVPSLARHGTALMNNAWGHLPLLNYRSVEAQHMGTAQQVLMANSSWQNMGYGHVIDCQGPSGGGWVAWIINGIIYTRVHVFVWERGYYKKYNILILWETSTSIGLGWRY